MSIGVDRLVFALNQLDQFKEDDNNNILVCVLDPNYLDQYYKIVNELRENNINSEIYLDTTKKSKKAINLCR